ncbi:hypothetical protein BgAZ_106960 [Babesia gibsoni]|uniref:CHCH domain-containing protein n=1 Tax=Babesia gibsoni TaxID=33632 RepID=A0AAD8US71_BABGI|nr:hypothetical protein BgAZ_106960 [Babesia gibsoni]
MRKDADSNVLDYDDRIAQTGCAEQYDCLLDCLDKHNREWKRCQSELKELGKCMKGADPKTRQPPGQK